MHLLLLQGSYAFTNFDKTFCWIKIYAYSSWNFKVKYFQLKILIITMQTAILFYLCIFLYNNEFFNPEYYSFIILILSLVASGLISPQILLCLKLKILWSFKNLKQICNPFLVSYKQLSFKRFIIKRLLMPFLHVFSQKPNSWLVFKSMAVFLFK